MHEKCKDVPHDIGILLAKEVRLHNLVACSEFESEHAKRMEEFSQEFGQIFKDFFKPEDKKNE